MRYRHVRIVECSYRNTYVCVIVRPILLSVKKPRHQQNIHVTYTQTTEEVNVLPLLSPTFETNTSVISQSVIKYKRISSTLCIRFNLAHVDVQSTVVFNILTHVPSGKRNSLFSDTKPDFSLQMLSVMWVSHLCRRTQTAHPAPAEKIYCKFQTISRHFSLALKPEWEFFSGFFRLQLIFR